ncbi:hypothetical protein HU200_035508 [Digitaria exilis]|uniref:Uncharacterized protein n=1 Tax=Digitaria exilis TaxID=1010633 RepID=A0A835BN77_9POAL|nr:hypothetical protein HU200_035508 [Digitaria exilis]
MLVLTVADVIVVRTGTATRRRWRRRRHGRRRAALGSDMVVVVRSVVVVVGPALQPTVNVSQRHVLKYLESSTGQSRRSPTPCRGTSTSATPPTRTSAGRYICCDAVLHREDVVGTLRRFFPE